MKLNVELADEKMFCAAGRKAKKETMSECHSFIGTEF